MCNFSDPFGLFRLDGAAAQQYVRELQAEAAGGDPEKSVSRQVAEHVKTVWTKALKKFGFDGAEALAGVVSEIPISVTPSVEVMMGPVAFSVSPDATSVSFSPSATIAVVGTVTVGTPGAGGPGTVSAGALIGLGPVVGVSGSVGSGGRVGGSLSAGFGVSLLPIRGASLPARAVGNTSVTPLQQPHARRR